MGNPSTVPLLVEVLQTEAYASGEYAAQPRSVIEVLGAVGGATAAQAVLDEARSSDPADFLLPEDSDGFVWALTAIGADAYELLAPLVEAPVPAPTDPVQQLDALLRRIATVALGGSAEPSPRWSLPCSGPPAAPRSGNR